MRTEINGVVDIEKLKADAKTFIQSISLETADASGDKLGYIVNQVQAQESEGIALYPLTNDEVVELYNEVYPAPISEPVEDKPLL